MDHKKYKHAFQQIRFSEHLEEDILSNLEKRNNKKRKDLSHQITQKSDTSGFCAYQLADRCS